MVSFVLSVRFAPAVSRVTAAVPGRALPTASTKDPPLTVVAPVKVLGPDSVHVPLPDLSRAVLLAPPLSTMAPASSPVPAAEPCSVSVLLPTPVAVSALLNLSKAVPDWSIVPPPVVPARLITRSVVAAPPV